MVWSSPFLESRQLQSEPLVEVIPQHTEKPLVSTLSSPQHQLTTQAHMVAQRMWDVHMYTQNCLFQPYQLKAFVSTTPKTDTQKVTGLRNLSEEREMDQEIHREMH